MRFVHFLAWFIVIDALITVFGLMTAPLLLIVGADTVVGLRILRDYLELRRRGWQAAGMKTDAGPRAVATVSAPVFSDPRWLQHIS